MHRFGRASASLREKAKHKLNNDNINNLILLLKKNKKFNFVKLKKTSFKKEEKLILLLHASSLGCALGSAEAPKRERAKAMLFPPEKLVNFVYFAPSKKEWNGYIFMILLRC